MRLPLALLSVLAATATAASAHAAAPVRLVEAFATPDFDPRAVLQVTPANPVQKADPNYNYMASLLGDGLARARLNIRQDAVYPDVYILFDYKAASIPFFRRAESAVSDPSYRAMVVTAIRAKPWKESGTLEVLWQTVVDQTGISNNADRTVPKLVEAGARYYGRNLTPKGLNVAASCSPSYAGTTGSHIAGFCSDTLTPQGLGNLGASTGTGGGGLAR